MALAAQNPLTSGDHVTDPPGQAALRVRACIIEPIARSPPGHPGTLAYAGDTAAIPFQAAVPRLRQDPKAHPRVLMDQPGRIPAVRLPRTSRQCSSISGRVLPWGCIRHNMSDVYSRLMKRTQIYIDEELDSQLRAAAATEGRSAAALIRDAVRQYLRRKARSTPSDPFLELAGTFTGGPPDASTEHDRYLYGPGRRRR